MFLVGAFAVSCTISLLSSIRDARGSGALETEKISLGFDGVVLQDRGNNCGAASLKMVLDRRGIDVSLRELELRLRATRHGSSLLALKTTAESYGLHADGWKLRGEDLFRISPPVILFVESSHFVVLDSLDADGFLFLRDPAMGRVKIMKQHLMNIWKGEALVFDGEASPGG
jgi:ABC-type bacteriocin/lantibiotic exporter with double-glycine peptidase domain